MSDTLQLTKEELENLIKAGVQEAKLEILIQDFQAHKQDEEKRLIVIDKNIADIYDLIRSFPDKVHSCKEQLEADIHDELERHYATDADLRALRKDMDSKIDQITGRFKWTVGIIVSAAGVLQFLTTIFYLGYQIKQLAGG